jgi:hypothetical protein
MKVPPERLSEIRARVGAASPGPWEADAVTPTAEGKFLLGPTPVGYEREYLVGDAEFMAAARADVPDLADDLEEARRDGQAMLEGAKKSAAEFLRADAAFLTARAELFRLEWSGRMQGDPACPRCWALWKMGAKHAPDCSLARGLGLAPEGLVRAKAQREEVIGDIRITAESPDGEFWVVSSTRVSTGETMAVVSLPAGYSRLLDRAFAAGQEFERLRAAALADGGRDL